MKNDKPVLPHSPFLPFPHSPFPLLLPFSAVAALLFWQLGALTFVDPDLWHEMALFREALALGHLPFADQFAYTPTVYPSVQHEWGTGAVLYFLATRFGSTGILIAKYLLTLGVVALGMAAARRRGAGWPVIVSLAPLAILCGVIGYTTIRAQLFTLLFIALLLYSLELDRAGLRRWIWAWLPLYTVWLNLHAGFIVGLGFVAGHAGEQWLRGQPYKHLLGVAAAMIALVAVNPYGLAYYGYLAHALSMPRPLITEWAPLWSTDPAMFRMFLVTLLIVAYCAANLGWRRLPGLIVLSLAAYAAARHTRHLSIYLVVWQCYAPSYVQQTPLGRWLGEFWSGRRNLVAGVSAACGLLCLVGALAAAPWQLRLPVTLDAEREGKPVYPVGAVEYLSRTQFRGNLMVPFIPGGYVIWKLHPRVRVSLDGRYEVAYQKGVLEENTALYEAQAGWQETLTRYPTDAVLVARSAPLAEALTTVPGWRRIYRDEAFELFARSGLNLPEEDRTGQIPQPQFP